MAKKYFVSFIYLLVLFLVQVAATEVFSENLHLIPQLTLLFVVVFALTHTLVETLWLSFVSGFLLEFFSGAFSGSQIFAVVAVGLVVYFLTRRLTVRDITFPTALMLVGFTTLWFTFGMFLFHSAAVIVNFTPDFLPLRNFYTAKLIWTVILNLLFFYPVRLGFKFFRLMHEKSLSSQKLD